MLSSWLSVLSLAAATHLAQSQTVLPKTLVSKCATDHTDDLEFKYCIEETDPAANSDILYFLHKEGGNEQSWSKDADTRALREEWAKAGLAAPTIISISFGSQWLLTQRARGPIADFHAYFTNILMAKLEGQLTTPRNGQRLLLGVNMGGFNAAMLLLKSASHFKKVALVCPSIFEANPFNAANEAEKAKMNWVRTELSSPEEWPKHDPVLLAATRLTRSSPELYVSCSDKEESGSAPATSKLASIAIEKGVSVEFHTLKGPTCTLDAHSLARFLVPPTKTAKLP